MQYRELDQLLTTVESSEAAMERWITESSEAVEPLADLEFIDDTTAETVRQSLAESASETAATLVSTHDEAESVSVLPWHDDLQEAKHRYLAHSEAWLTHLLAVADEPSQAFERQPEISGTFRSAQLAFDRAIPPFALGDSRKRIAQIFAE